MLLRRGLACSAGGRSGILTEECAPIEPHMCADSMNDIQHLIAEYATINVLDHDIHERTSMAQHDRVFPFYVMSYMKEGSSVIRHDAGVITANVGDVIIVPPNLRHDHTMERSRHTIFFWWHFTLSIGRQLDVLRVINEPTAFRLEHREEFENKFVEYVELSRRQSPSLSIQLLRRAKALEVLAYVLEGASVLRYVKDGFADVPDEFASMIRDLVETPEVYRHVNALAERYGYHPTYVTNRFKHFFGTTPGRLGRALLCEKAELLIRSRDLSLSEVAEELNFSDASSFTRFFKAEKGISPLTYRNSKL